MNNHPWIYFLPACARWQAAIHSLQFNRALFDDFGVTEPND
jgi:hypothetical protein